MMSERERLEREEHARQWARKQRLREERNILAEYARMNSDPVRAGEFLLTPALVKLLRTQALERPKLVGVKEESSAGRGPEIPF
jgi:hypothetical protein